MGLKPFRFGVNLRTASSGEAWRDAARRVEALGYSTLTVPDHFTDMFSPMPAVVSAAAATERLRVGTLVLNNDFRHPVLLAREAAVVDVLTDGRLQLGLGAGYMRSEYERRSRWGISYYVVFEPAMEAFAPIVARLSGT